MKRLSYKSLLLLASAVFCLSSCSEDVNESSQRLAVAAFYPDIVMDGSEISITGTALGDVKEVVFPGNVSSTDVKLVEGGQLVVKVPSGVSTEAGSICVRTADDEAVSRQTLRKAQPKVSFYQFEDTEGAMTNKDITLYGEDLLFADWVAFTATDGITAQVEAIRFQRKSASAVRVKIPADAPIADDVTLTIGFKNGTSMELAEHVSIQKGMTGGYWEEQETTVFEGETDFSNWSQQVRINKNDLLKASFAPEATLRIYGDCYEDAQIQFNNAIWDAKDYYFNAEAGSGRIDIYIDEDIYHHIMDIEDGWSDTGIILNGKGMTITKVTVIAKVWVSGEPPTTDPITAETIMLLDWEPYANHSGDWDGSWSGITELVTADDGNHYLRVTTDGEGWFVNCNHQGNLDWTLGVVNAADYAIKFDLFIEEGVTGASAAAMQYVLGDGWHWFGEGFFPETTGGQWITVTRNLSDLGIEGEIDLGSGTNGIYGGPIPAGICIDNFRLDPVK